MLEGVTWFTQSAFRFRRGGKVVYIDPWHLPDDLDEADLILITHGHGDHLSEKDLVKIRGEKAEIVVPESSADKVEDPKHEVNPGDTLTVAGVPIQVVAAYNVDSDFHPKDNSWVGYVIELDGVTYYHTGDSDFIDEMEAVTTDVMLVPVGGRYTMGPEGAAKATKAVGPKLAVPMHWGDVVGSEVEVQAFVKEWGGTTEILERGKEA